MKKQNQPLTNKRIGIFGKGGAGKSTVVVLLAQAIQARGYQVCVLDADSTNFGLSQALGIGSPSKPLLDFYGGAVFSGGLVTCPVDDPTPLPNAKIFLDELPPQYYTRNEDGITLLVTGKIGDQGPGAGCDGPVAKIARDFVIRGRHQEFVTLVDFKAGFEDSARGAVTGLDWAVIVIDPTTASLKMAADMRNMIDQIKADVLPATAHLESPEMVALANKIFTEATIEDVFFVLNQVPDAEIENYLREQLKQREITPIGVISKDPSIPLAWLKGTQVHATKALSDVQIIVDKLEERIGGSS
ncbi:MAG: P-loop NTPase [Chloroflexi bacterium]|nr:P-loop NTPase [Chloroflexota bacterium]